MSTARGARAAFRGRRLEGQAVDFAARGIVGALLTPSDASAAPLLPPAGGAASRAVGGVKRPPPPRARRGYGRDRGNKGGGASSDEEEEAAAAVEDAAADDGAAAASAAAAATAAALENAPIEMQTWALGHPFDSATYWLHDTAASDWDSLPLGISWFALSAALHGAVSERELAEVFGAR